MYHKYMFGIVTIFSCFYVTSSSVGDRSEIYRNCMSTCYNKKCTGSTGAADGFIWKCPDECKYECMWDTVDIFVKNGRTIPQFHGKWPFVRWLGMQEPASALFSLMNLLSHVVMLRQFMALVPRHAPFFWLWITYSLVCVNAWFWSTVFHTKDTDFAEKMDYFCAFSMVLFSFYSACIRLLGSKPRLPSILISLFCMGFLIYHCAYLSLVSFDYGYNMKANIFVGAVNVITWLVWCWLQRTRLPYVWKCALTVTLVSLSVLLETADFPPIAWTLDAHALWHLTTAPLPLLWYSFLIDDCLHQLGEKKLGKSV